MTAESGVDLLPILEASDEGLVLKIRVPHGVSQKWIHYFRTGPREPPRSKSQREKR